jgi:hypothetical protein
MAKFPVRQIMSVEGDAGHDSAIREVMEAEGDLQALGGAHGPIDGGLFRSHR